MKTLELRSISRFVTLPLNDLLFSNAPHDRYTCITPRALRAAAFGVSAASSARLSAERPVAKVSGASQIGQLK
jgi:hypothetical protein